MFVEWIKEYMKMIPLTHTDRTCTFTVPPVLRLALGSTTTRPCQVGVCWLCLHQSQGCRMTVGGSRPICLHWPLLLLKNKKLHFRMAFLFLKKSTWKHCREPMKVPWALGTVPGQSFILCPASEFGFHPLSSVRFGKVTWHPHLQKWDEWRCNNMKKNIPC